MCDTYLSLWSNVSNPMACTGGASRGGILYEITEVFNVIPLPGDSNATVMFNV